MPDLTNDIAQQAVEPASVTADGQSTTARPLGDTIKGQQFLDAKAAAKKRRRGVLMTVLTTPGALGDCGRVQHRNFDGSFG
ncbi:MAG TPA: hypothetical protein VGE74_04695 [Gemmata sp.]